MSDNLPTPRKTAVPAVRQQLANRTAEMLGHQEPEIRWQRQVTPDAQVWVRVDGPLVIDDGLFEIATATPIAARQSDFPPMVPYGDSGLLRRPQVVLRSTGPVRPWPGVTAAPSDWRWCRVWQQLVVVGQEDEGRMWVAGVNPLTGALAWELEADGDDAKLWERWFAENNGVSRPRHRDASVGLMDLTTRRPRWRVPRERLQGVGDQRRATTADEAHVVHDDAAHIFAGLDTADGTVLWTTDPAPDIAVSYGLVGHHVVRLLYRTRRLAGDERMCDCYQPTASNDEPNECRSCGKTLPWMTIEVRDRTSGRPLWTHRWPWAEPGDMVNGALAVCGEAVLTWEGGFLRARHVTDGSHLWSVPRVSVVGRPAGPFGSERQRFVTCDMDSPCRWAWLQSMEFFDDSDKVDDVFVHAATGRVVRLADVFHHTEDDLVLTLTGNTLTCVALPGATPH